VVALLIAGIIIVVKGLSVGEAFAVAVGALVLVQIVPVSPGSLVRGCYTLSVAIRARDFMSYNIAVFMSFFKYIGYLAFPIQMVYRYPALAKFMAGHWATGAVKLVPVFGEHGALLEHWVFDKFFNYPLTLRRRKRVIQQQRAGKPSRFWHALPLAVFGAVLVQAFAFSRWNDWADVIPTAKQTWYVVVFVAFLIGRYTARWAGGARTSARIISGLVTGLLAGVLNAIVYTSLSVAVFGDVMNPGDLAAGLASQAKYLLSRCAWHGFAFGVWGAIGAMAAEFIVGEPKNQASTTA